MMTVPEVTPIQPLPLLVSTVVPTRLLLMKISAAGCDEIATRALPESTGNGVAETAGATGVFVGITASVEGSGFGEFRSRFGLRESLLNGFGGVVGFAPDGILDAAGVPSGAADA